MGSNLTVTVAWGIDPFESGEEPWAGGEPEEWLLRSTGAWVDPPPDPIDWNHMSPTERSARDGWHKVRNAALAELDVELLLIGVPADYANWILVIKSTIQTNHNDCMNLGTPVFCPSADQIVEFKKFCTKANIGCNNPGIKVFANYG